MRVFVENMLFGNRSVGASDGVVASNEIPIISKGDRLPLCNRAAELNILQTATTEEKIITNTRYAIGNYNRTGQYFSY